MTFLIFACIPLYSMLVYWYFRDWINPVPAPGEYIEGYHEFTVDPQLLGANGIYLFKENVISSINDLFCTNGFATAHVVVFLDKYKVPHCDLNVHLPC